MKRRCISTNKDKGKDIDLMIISSTWKVQQQSKAESSPNGRPLSQRLQPPLPILINILSFIELSLGRTSTCGVNKQWLIASLNVPNPTVKWEKGIISRLPSFVLALRKHPSATSFIDFPINELRYLTAHQSFDMSTLRSLSLMNHPSLSYSTIMNPTIWMRLAGSSSLQSLTIHHGPNADGHLVNRCYDWSSSLLGSFNEGYLKGTKTDNDVPKIRFNGCLPIKCDDHGYTYQRLCKWCHQSKNICCNRSFSDCDPERACGKVKGVSNPYGKCSSRCIMYDVYENKLFREVVVWLLT
jgi:hypothetical protein